MEIYELLLLFNIISPCTNVQLSLTQTLHPITLLQFLKGSYLELIKSAQNAEEIRFLINVFTEIGCEMKKISKNYLNKLQNLLITNKGNSEDIKKVVKLTWFPISGTKLKQALKPLKLFLHQAQI